MQNAEVFKDKVVLDIGCGTGVLSIFAAKAGAKHVYGIEFAEIAEYTKLVVKENNLEDKITIIKSKVEEAELPVPQVDIIISEWMGYFLFFESMLDSVLYARDKWLKKDGYLLPDKAMMYIAAFEDSKKRKEKIDFWDNICDVKMSCFKPTVLSSPLIEQLPKEKVISSSCKICEIDLYTAKVEDVDVASKYQLTFTRDDKFGGIVAWFNVEFSRLPNKSILSTSPFSGVTHWRQTIFFTKDEIPVKKDQTVSGSFCFRKSQFNFRFTDVKILFKLEREGKLEEWYQLYKVDPCFTKI